MIHRACLAAACLTLFLAAPLARAGEAESRRTPSGLAYLDTGGGDEAVVLIHGWASAKEIWRGRIEPLAERWRVLALDLPGYGDSPQPEAGHSMDAYADAVVEVMNHADVDQAVIVGHDNGVPVARQVYRRHPDRAAAIVSVEGAFDSLVESPAEAEPFFQMWRSPHYKQPLRQFFNSMLHRDLPDDERQRVMDIVLETPQKTLVGGMRAAMRPEIWKDDPVNIPVLIIHAEGPFWTDDYLAYIRQMIPDVEIHTMTDVSHFLMLDKPEQFDQLVIDFTAKRELIDSD